jgi:integrase
MVSQNHNNHVQAQVNQNNAVNSALHRQNMALKQPLQSLEPLEAVNLYIGSLDLADSTIDSYQSHLRQFLRWAESNDIKNMNDIDGRKLERFRQKRQSDLNGRNTLQTDMSILREFVRYCENIEGVTPGTAEKINIPTVTKEENIHHESLEPERAKPMLDFLNKFAYASRDHVIILTLLHTGIRMGALRSLDLSDFEDGAQPYLDLNHRPDTDTPLKTTERPIAISDKVAEVIVDYVNYSRHDVTDKFDREPLFTTRQGRISKSTIQRTTYKCSQPEIMDSDKEPIKITYQDSYAKEGTVSPHVLRSTAITRMLRDEWPIEQVSDRVGATVGTIEDHYDEMTQHEKMEQRRQLL